MEKNRKNNPDTGSTSSSSLSPERLSQGIDEILTGGPEALQQVEIVKAALKTISNLLVEKNDLDMNILLGQMIVGLHGEDEEQRQDAAIVLACTLNNLALQKEWQRMIKLLPAIKQTISVAGDNDEVAQQSITALTKLVAHHISQENYEAARDTLLIISGPTTWSSTPQQLQEYAEPAIANLFSKKTQATLLNTYLYGDEKQEEAGRLLVAFGEQAVEFLMEFLQLSNSKVERLQVLNLIEDIGVPAESSLLRMLQQEDTPWYLTRNIIRLLGVSGNPDCFDEIALFLDHDDIRVKEEVLKAAGNIGERTQKEFLLQALHTVPEKLIELVVSQLGDIPDDSLVAPLAALLDKASSSPNTISDELQIATCQAFGKIGSIKALPMLTKIICNYTIPPDSVNDKLREDPILQAAVKAAQLIERGGNEKIPQTRVTKVLGVPMAADPVSARESAILRIAVSGDKELATRKLFELINECVLKKDFPNAERLRDRFKEINPLALTEIIQSAEIIEQAKLEISGSGYFEVWANLLDKLSPEEFRAIYHELENCTLQPEELLISQGDKNDELFFINHGSVKVFYKQNEHEVYIKTLGSGDLAGENFFDASIWTISLSALTPSRISILKRSSFIRWQEAFPGLAGKLKSFYNRSNNVNDLIKQKGLNRRAFERYHISRKAKIQMVDGVGKPMGRGFNGKLFNISAGGLALLLRIAQHEHGRVLLGRKMRVAIPVIGKSPEIQVYGQVLAIHPFTPQTNAHLIHFTFSDELDQEMLQSVLG